MRSLLVLFVLFFLYGCSNNETAGGATEATNGIAKDTVVVSSRDTIHVFHRDSIVYRDTVVYRDTLYSKDTLYISGGNKVAIEREIVSGKIQKGPFVAGAPVTLWELKENGVDFTGRGFRTSTNAKGEFTLYADSLQSKYAVVESKGRFRNELTGEVTAVELTLSALVELGGEDNVNANPLTQLEYERAANLVRQEKVDVASAKNQAKTELSEAYFGTDDMADFETLDVFGDGQDDGRLLALSVMMLSYGDETGVSDYMSNVVENLNSGMDPEEAVQKEPMEKAWKFGEVSLDMVKENIESWGMGKASDYLEQELSDVLTGKFGACSEAVEGTLQQNVEFGETVQYVCHQGSWVRSFLKPGFDYGRFTDSRDGTVYRTTKIGDQTWMAENLRYMPENAEGVGCYNGNEFYCKKYGGYYTNAAAQQYCPSGWHVPTRDEWYLLFKNIPGGYDEESDTYDLNLVASKLRAIGGWSKTKYPDMETPTDPYGFAALPAGVYDYGDEGHFGYFHTSTKFGMVSYYDFGISNDEGIESNARTDIDVLISVRCLKD